MGNLPTPGAPCNNLPSESRNAKHDTAQQAFQDYLSAAPGGPTLVELKPHLGRWSSLVESGPDSALAKVSRIRADAEVAPNVAGAGPRSSKWVEIDPSLIAFGPKWSMLVETAQHLGELDPKSPELDRCGPSVSAEIGPESAEFWRSRPDSARLGKQPPS